MRPDRFGLVRYLYIHGSRYQWPYRNLVLQQLNSHFDFLNEWREQSRYIRLHAKGKASQLSRAGILPCKHSLFSHCWHLLHNVGSVESCQLSSSWTILAIYRNIYFLGCQRLHHTTILHSSAHNTTDLQRLPKRYLRCIGHNSIQHSAHCSRPARFPFLRLVQNCELLLNRWINSQSLYLRRYSWWLEYNKHFADVNSV